MERSISFNPRFDNEFPNERSSDIGYSANDRRLAYSRSFQQSHGPRTPAVTEAAKPYLDRTVSSIDMPPEIYAVDGNDVFSGEGKAAAAGKVSVLLHMVWEIYGVLRNGNRQIKRLFLLISLNVAYSTTELLIGLLTGRVGLVSDAFHLTFGCGLLTFSLFAMATSRKKPDHAYSYGYKRLEVLAAFTNALFLMFMSFSLAVEALHAFIQDESEHKHYLIVSAVTNLLVNLIGVWFFRHYARVNIAYRKAEDMNYHSVCLHVIADSIRSAGLILASWLLSLGVENAEVLCLGLVSVTVFMLVMPLFKATGGVLLQMAPPNIPSSALNKCLRQITSREDVMEVLQARFWEVVPGHTVGSLRLQVKSGIDERPLLQYVYDVYHDLGVQDLTLQTDYT
ncbi:unnamed protein product [Arabis nemorensis]|uniref:Cation efflux protein transmembrane domain-containing protein n=1 Tax=Arabis nemorensis TaxID=586526 RepID=A0A565B8W4_9BRAS|nr:unnamed protein product [Arabis nemorensis]